MPVPFVETRIDGTGLTRSFGGAQAKFDARIRAALERTVEIATAYARTSRLYKSHTGRLRESIKGFVINGMGGTTGLMPQARVEARAPYAKFVHDGTPPHEIEARRKKSLSFIWNGQRRFFRRVFHPGTMERPFMREAEQATTPLFEKLVSEAFVRAFL